MMIRMKTPATPVAGTDLAPLREGQVRFRVHGVKTEHGEDPVLADVFARKLTALVMAMKAADSAVNGSPSFDYVITALREGSAVVEIQERQIRVAPIRMRAIGAFESCVSALRSGDREAAAIFGDCSRRIADLGSGAEKNFAYGELWINGYEPVRVDSFLKEQARAVYEKTEPARPAEQKWFKGVAIGAFEGTVKLADLRGALPLVRLVLAAGGKEIDCVMSGFSTDQIKDLLNSKVEIEGRAIYDGRSGLPRRIEALKVTALRVGADIARWKGAFKTFEPEDWDHKE